ncbi:MAG: phospholipase [Acidimicrobiia bacterium]
MSAAHVHEHAHPHPHPHPDPHVAPLGGPAVLDIGGDVGALVLHLDTSHLGTEIHIRPAGRPGEPTTHTGVWERVVGGRAMVVAVFPGVLEGRYDVLDADGAPVMVVTITGGEVAEAAVIHAGGGGEVMPDHIVVMGGRSC